VAAENSAVGLYGVGGGGGGDGGLVGAVGNETVGIGGREMQIENLRPPQ